MYKEVETRVSYKYLKEVITALKEPICILEGWAVFSMQMRILRKPKEDLI